MMKTYLILLGLCGLTLAAPQASPAPQPQRPQIDWGLCPQLEPTETEVAAKSNILKTCLEQFPLPTQAVPIETINQHQKNITGCALKTENWFNTDGSYKFEKASTEIKNKKLKPEMEKALIEAHGKCSKDAKDKMATMKLDAVDQVQIYQSCMDAHITENCKIQIMKPQ